MQGVCRLRTLAIRQQNSLVEQAAASTGHWSPLIGCAPFISENAEYHSTTVQRSSSKRRRRALLSDDDGWERLVAFHRREVLDRPGAGKIAPLVPDRKQSHDATVKNGEDVAPSAPDVATDSDVSFSELVAVEAGRLPGYCAPVFPQEAHVSPVPKGRLTSMSHITFRFVSRKLLSDLLLPCSSQDRAIARCLPLNALVGMTLPAVLVGVRMTGAHVWVAGRWKCG